MTPEQAAQRAQRSVPTPVAEVCARLHEAGHGAWVVGGCLRDVLLGHTPSDWDVATTAEPQQVMRCFRRVIPTGIEHGTVMVRHRGRSFEVTTLRGESTYSDARRPDSVFFVKDIVQDLARRDFTVNAMAYDPLSHVLVDAWGGLDDLAQRCLRTVGDPLARFREDGLRVLRAARFVASLEFSLDPATKAAIEPALPSFARVSRERVRDEWLKALRAARPAPAFALMAETGILAETHPELAASARAPDLKPAWDEVLRGVDCARPDPLLRLAALLRGLVLSRPAAELAAAVADIDGWLRSYRYSNAERETIVHLLRHLPEALRLTPEPVVVRRWLVQVGAEQAESVLDLARAHLESCTACTSDQSAQLDAVYTQLREACAARLPVRVADLAITGRDVMQHLGCPPGPQIGRLLQQLLEHVVVDPDLNQRDRLLELIDQQRDRGRI